MNKKAQGLSINVIIIVAIALIVMVVLIAVFTGRLGVFTQTVKGAVSCTESCHAAGYASGAKVTGEDSPTPGVRDGENNRCLCANGEDDDGEDDDAEDDDAG